MSEARITELEAQLLTATATVAQLTKANAELGVELARSELLLKKNRRNSKNDSSNLRAQINTLENRRG